MARLELAFLLMGFLFASSAHAGEPAPGSPPPNAPPGAPAGAGGGASSGASASTPAPAAAAAPATPAAAQAAAPGVTHEVDVQGLHAALAAGHPPLLDVRTPEEFAQGHVAGAVNLPIAELDARLSELERYRGKPLYVICQSGGRSARAVETLRAKGYLPVNVLGGTAGWISAGYPVVK